MEDICKKPEIKNEYTSDIYELSLLNKVKSVIEDIIEEECVHRGKMIEKKERIQKKWFYKLFFKNSMNLIDEFIKNSDYFIEMNKKELENYKKRIFEIELKYKR